MRGIKHYTSDAGFHVIRLHYTADREKDPSNPVGAAWYEKALKGYPGGTKSSAWRQEYELDWDATGGELVFPQLSEFEDIIVVNPFMVPETWALYGSFDYGHRNPSSFHVYAIDHDENIYSVWEYYMSGKGYRFIAESIRKCPYFDRLQYLPLADPSIWAQNQQNTMGGSENVMKSIAQLFAELEPDLRIWFAPGKKGGDITAAEKINSLLWNEHELRAGEKPRFYIFKSCPMQVWELKKLRYKDWSAVMQEQRNLQEEIVDRDNHCYDNITEILTEVGWKRFADLSYEDRVATMVNGMLEFEKPNEIISNFYIGDMLTYKTTGGLDFCVTPNHRFLYGNHWTCVEIKKPQFSLDYYDSMPKYSWVPREVRWEADDITESPIGRFDVDDIIAWYGFWLAEGCKSSNHRGSYYAHVDQKDPDKELIDLMIRLQCGHSRKNREGITRFSLGVEFYRLVKDQGLSYQKYIPLWIKKCSSRQAKILLHWMWKGDGSKNGRRYSTVSKRLADDVQEMALKAGMVAVVGSHLRDKSTLPSGKIIKPRNIYYVDIQKGKKGQAGIGEYSQLCQINKAKVKKIKYMGMVHCVSTSSGVIYVRRNGRPMWCGNSYDDLKMFLAMFFMAPSEKPAQKMQELKKIDPVSYNEWMSVAKMHGEVSRNKGTMGDF